MYDYVIKHCHQVEELDPFFLMVERELLSSPLSLHQ